MQQEFNEISYLRDYFGRDGEASAAYLTQIVTTCAATVSNLAAVSDNTAALESIASQLENKGVNILSNLLHDKSSFTITELDIMRVIIATDGTRPSYPVSDNMPVTSLYDDSDWKNRTDSRAPALRQAISCTGRINIPGGIAGTGFLVAPNLIMTNRHVLQAITERNNRTAFVNHVSIDFGCEDLASDGALNTEILKVIYPGVNEITTPNHRFMDMALLEIGYREDLPKPMKICAEYEQDAGTGIFLIGFPNQQKAPLNAGTVYRDFFENFMGYKKVAPGNIITAFDSWPGRFSHDASTLRGNSGSMVVAIGNESCAMGLHYGGIQGINPENWAHGLNLFCDPENDVRHILDTYGAEYV